MLYAVLTCSDGECDIAYEAWGEPGDLEALVCEDCGCALEIVAFANADRDGTRPRRAQLQQRDAA
jgi:hypothetical protein